MQNLPAEEARDVSWTAMTGLLGGRLAAISAFLIVLSFVLKQDSVAFYSFIAFAYIVTIPYSLWMRNQDKMRRLAPLQFLVDLVFISGLVYFTGGLQNDYLILLYPLIILSAGIILPLRQTVQITVLAIISYALVTVMMSQNILVQYPSGYVSQNLAGNSGGMALRIFVFVAFGIASAYVSRRCDYISKKEKQLRAVTKLIFERVKTGLLLLDAGDRILMANGRACILLGCEEPELIGKSLSSIRLKPDEIKNRDADLKGAADYFRRSDGSVFPVSIEDASITFPCDAVPNVNAAGDSSLDARILNFTDLSHFLRLQGQARQLERIKAAAIMAREMAHHIRTPLTGISGAVQILQRNMGSNGLADAPGGKERQDICRQILAESMRMDKVIQNFLDYAEFSPQDIHDLIQMDIDQESKMR
jgi:two-component system, NtrC family, sensor histidine kinase PilS